MDITQLLPVALHRFGITLYIWKRGFLIDRDVRIPAGTPDRCGYVSTCERLVGRELFRFEVAQ